MWYGKRARYSWLIQGKKWGTNVARGYQSYRGRRSGSTKLLIALLVVILLAACLFMFIQSYASYTDDGQLHFKLPFLQDQEEEEPAPPDSKDPSGDRDLNLVIDGPDGQQTPVEPADDPEPPEAGEWWLLELSALPADGVELEQNLASTGANGFVYPVRDNTGRVFFASPTAADKAAVGDEAATELLRSLCADTLAVAKFNCFHDSYYAFTHMQDAAICQKTGYVWYDNHSYHWLDPSKEQARSYVIGLAVECAELGFDELLLEELAYPTRGKLEKIDYSGNTIGKTEALTLFLTELRTALEPYGTKISLLLTEELIQAGVNEESGEDLSALLPLVDAVYAQVSSVSEAQSLLAAAAGDGPVPALVPLVTEAHEGSWCMPLA